MNKSAEAKAALARRRNWLPRTLHPGQIIVLSFLAVISAGAILLSLPAAARDGERLNFVDALFTATSATCVTGLALVDTGTRFSTFGQLVILGCIQIGGLGLMTFTTVFLVATGRRLAIADRIIIQESFYHSPTGKLSHLIRYVIAATLVTEAVGAICLTFRWWTNGTFPSLGAAAYSGVFHAVSAFCNAGFSLFPNNLTGIRGDPFAITVISALIIAGGLGFLVGLDLKEYVQQRLFASLWPERVRERIAAIRPRPRLSLHTKLVLSTTAALLVNGAISYYGLERSGALSQMSAGEAAWNAWFCSVTARTAGFNTIDYTQVGGPALLCTMVLMFIGASPGSAGGGVKTSTFALLLIYALYRWRGHGSPHVFHRSIPRETLDRASAVVVSAVGFIIIAASFVMATEASSLSHPESQTKFLPVLFETFSAFGTVGLSMNFTPSLSTAGKLVIAFTMLVGRVGPLTLALALATRHKPPKITYAEENVMVG